MIPEITLMDKQLKIVQYDTYKDLYDVTLQITISPFSRYTLNSNEQKTRCYLPLFLG